MTNHRNLIFGLTPYSPIKSADFWHFPYLVNQVLLLKIEYLYKLIILSKKDMINIGWPLYGFCKRAARLSINTKNNIIHHLGIMEIKSLWDNYLIAHTTS